MHASSLSESVTSETKVTTICAQQRIYTANIVNIETVVTHGQHTSLYNLQTNLMN